MNDQIQPRDADDPAASSSSFAAEKAGRKIVKVESEEQRPDKQRIEVLRRAIDGYYEVIPTKLGDLPDAQGRCLELLSNAEQLLTPPVGRKDIIDARVILTKLDIEVRRCQSAKYSLWLVAALVYGFALTFGLLYWTGVIKANVAAQQLNQELVMGVPVPILIWGVIGSLTSMLLRAGYFPFSDRTEALRWFCFRPIVGVVMGVLTYLMVIAGLIVFTGEADPETPELLWVIAFVGSFSDTLSINLLQRIVGEFQTRDSLRAGSKKTNPKTPATP